MTTLSPSPPAAPWGTVIEQWLADCYLSKDASPETVVLRRYQAQRLGRWAGDRSLWDLTDEDLADWISGLGAANTRIAARAAVRSLYQWARKRGLVEVDPTEDLVKPRAPQPRPRPVPNDVYKRLLGEIADRRIRVALRLAGELGLRRAEVVNLSIDSVIEDEDGYWLRFVGKGSKERVVPCPDDIVTELLDLFEASPSSYFFPSSMRAGEPMSAHWMGTLIPRVLPDGYTMHKLRHRAGTEAYRRSGNDIYLASKLLGHSSVTTTQVYVKPDMSRLRAVVSGGDIE